jgi:hypothetical protein
MPGPDQPATYESVAPHTHVGRFRDVLRTWMKAMARRPASLGKRRRRTGRIDGRRGPTDELSATENAAIPRLF